MACHYGNMKMANFLLENQAKPNAKTKVSLFVAFQKIFNDIILFCM